MAVSTVPACIDALVAMARRVLPDAVLVTDGAPVEDIADDLMCIGWSGDPEDDGVAELERTKDQSSLDPDHEMYTVACRAYAWVGEQSDMKPVRDRVYELVTLVRDGLDQDQRLGGAVARAWISTDAYGQSQTDKGATASVAFTVNVDAWTG